MNKTPEELAGAYATKQHSDTHCKVSYGHKSARRGGVYTSIEQAYLAGYREAKPQWINVKDQWPKDGQLVLISEGINAGIAQAVVISSKAGSKLGFSKRFDSGEIRYWMPLPKPPEDK
jgi:hypothetical protein